MKNLQEWNKHKGRWMETWLDVLLTLSHLWLALLNNHLEALHRHTRSLGQMLIPFNIHWIQERVYCDCWDEVRDRPAFVWMHMKTKRKGSVSQGLFQLNKAWTTDRKIVARNCHQNTATFTKGEGSQKPMSMCMERYLGEKAYWYSRCHKRPSLAEVKGRALWQIVNVTNLPCSEEHCISKCFIKMREAWPQVRTFTAGEQSSTVWDNSPGSLSSSSRWWRSASFHTLLPVACGHRGGRLSLSEKRREWWMRLSVGVRPRTSKPRTRLRSLIRKMMTGTLR